MKPYTLKVNDSEPLEMVLSDLNGPVPLSDPGVEVTFAMQRERTGSPVIGGPCEVLDDGTVGLRGTARYVWADGDNSVPGVYRSVVTVVHPVTGQKTFPHRGYQSIIIEPVPA